MSASGGTVAMDLSSGVQYSVDNTRTSENDTTETAGKNDLLSKESDHVKALQETVSHPLQFTGEDGSPDSPKPVTENNADEDTKKGRRVTFGEGENIVSGFMDPPSPWNDVKLCSTEDLIAAYLTSCDKHNIKPIPRLLQQLHAITNFCDRNDTLSLRGERLDMRHCETLEEIVRRVQFRTIDLEATHLEEEGAIALFDMIEYYESCLRLNISYNRTIGPRGWHACSRMIKKTPCLEHLEARHCTISEQVMPMLGRSLRLGSSLTTLHLENSILSGRPLMILVAAIKLNDTLREIFLADNKLMPTDGIQLGNLLKVNHRLQVLDTRNNHLQDTGVGHICDGLYEQNQGQGLATLVLWNNQITFQAMHNVARALYSTQSLETLNLGHNSITNEGIHRLKEGLLHNKSLQRIGLQAAKISCEGAVALAEYIAESKSLLRLDLRENEIKTGGLMALSLALKMCMSINRVDLDKDPKKESGVKDYAEQQRRQLQDISNYMQRNRDLARLQEEQRLKEEQEREQQLAEATADTAAIQEEAEKQQEVGQGESVEDVKEKKEQENDQQQQKRLHLALPLFSRSQELESPAFVKETEMPVISPPETVLEEPADELQKTEDDQDVEQLLSSQVLPGEFPPSPMVSNNGSPLLAHVSEAMSQPPKKESSLHVPKHKKRSVSPSSHKFVISRVKESPHDKVSKAQGSDSSDSSPGEERLQAGDSSVTAKSEQLQQASSNEKTLLDGAAPVITVDSNSSGEKASQQDNTPTPEDSSQPDSSDTSGLAESGETGDLLAAQDSAAAAAGWESVTDAENVAEKASGNSPQNVSEEEGRENVSAEGPDKAAEVVEQGKQDCDPLSLNGISLELVQAMHSSAGDTAGAHEAAADAGEPAVSSADDFEKELDDMLADVIKSHLTN